MEEIKQNEVSEEVANAWANIYCHYANEAKAGETFYQWMFDNYNPKDLIKLNPKQND